MAIKSSTTLVTEALGQIKTISTDEAFEKSSKNECNPVSYTHLTLPTILLV